MLHLVTAMAYGDCLITLSLLEQVKSDADVWQILGTGVTARVSSLLRQPLPVIEMLPDKAAFYTFREDGPWKAWLDFISIKKSLSRFSKPGDVFAFERPDIRNTAVKPFNCQGIYAPQTHHAYDDRRALIQQLFGPMPEWAPVRRPTSPVRSVLINPCARYGDRWLAPEIIDNLIAIAAARNWSLTLLDPCRRYGDFRDRVERYESQTSLTDAAAMLRASDLYVGPDSFFIHLAYYYGIPLFGFFFSHYHDFLAPGMEQLGNFMDFNAACDRSTLEKGLMAFVAPEGDRYAG